MKLLVAILACSLAAPAFAETFPIKLMDGATWTLVAQHDREVLGSGGKSFSVVVTKRITYRATRTASGRLRMEHVAAEALSGMPPEAALTQTLDIPVEFDVDAALTPTAVINLAQVRDATRNLMLRSGATPQDIERMKRLNPDILDDTAMALVGRELAMLGRGQGLTLEKGKPLQQDEDSPNPIGGPPIRAHITVSLTSVDRASGRAIVEWRATLDPQSMRESMRAAFKHANPAKAAEADAEFDKTKIETDTLCGDEIDIATGLAVKVVCETRSAIITGDQSRGSVDRWTLTQTPPGKP